VTITIDGEKLEPVPGQTVMSHGADRNLSVDEIAASSSSTMQPCRGTNLRSRFKQAVSTHPGYPSGGQRRRAEGRTLARRTVFTGVFKDPVTGRRRVRMLNVDGEGQGDLAGHGGEQRAVFG
jgi:hypothetical protein